MSYDEGVGPMQRSLILPTVIALFGCGAPAGGAGAGVQTSASGGTMGTGGGAVGAAGEASAASVLNFAASRCGHS